MKTTDNPTLQSEKLEPQPPDQVWINNPATETEHDQRWWYEHSMAFPTVEYVRADLVSCAPVVAPQGGALTWFAIADARPVDTDQEVLLYRPTDLYCKFWVGRFSSNPAIKYVLLTAKGEMPLGEFTHWARLRAPSPSSPVPPGQFQPRICIECGHECGGDEQGCEAIVKEHPLTFCGCKCEFPAATPTPVEQERETLIYWLLRAYQSGHRDGWEPGPSTDETMDSICSVLANRGYDPSLSDAAKQLLNQKPRY